MAGGKETPRQKLIGLMYLVLLALLALQVSSAILQKFSFLNSSLELAVRNSNSANDGKLGAITVKLKLLGSGSAHHLAFKLDVR